MRPNVEILDTLRALRGRCTAFLVAFLLLLCATNARAWKVTTHMILAERAAASVADPDLRQTLIANVNYLRGGAVGPDLFYAPNFRIHLLQGSRSDLAHYCDTKALALAMLQHAGSDERLRAFAYGWLSHNVQDAVAHPWVNGFVHVKLWRVRPVSTAEQADTTYEMSIDPRP